MSLKRAGKVLERLKQRLADYLKSKDKKIKVGSPLRQFRQALGLGQADFGKEIGLKSWTISRWERDLGKPANEDLVRFQTILDKFSTKKSTEAPQKRRRRARSKGEKSHSATNAVTTHAAGDRASAISIDSSVFDQMTPDGRDEVVKTFELEAARLESRAKEWRKLAEALRTK